MKPKSTHHFFVIGILYPFNSLRKNYILHIFILFNFFIHAAAFGQTEKNLNPSSSKVILSILKNSDAPHTNNEHVYLLKAANTSDKDLSFSIQAKNINCEGKKNVNMDTRVYWTESESNTSVYGISGVTVVPAHSSVEFYVKIIRPANTPLNTWNCTEVKAVVGNNQVLSDGLVIQSFIPDPKDFR